MKRKATKRAPAAVTALPREIELKETHAQVLNTLAEAVGQAQKNIEQVENLLLRARAVLIEKQSTAVKFARTLAESYGIPLEEWDSEKWTLKTTERKFTRNA